jgi:hypothetical protein
VALMGASCMLLLNYGSAFRLSYAQLLLFIPLDADLKHISLIMPIHHGISLAQFYFFDADSFWTLISDFDLIFTSRVLEFYFLKNSRYKSN